MDKERLLAEIARFRYRWFEMGWPGEEDLSEMNRELRRIVDEAGGEPWYQGRG